MTTPAAASRPPPRASMSLSRRYLSLPQELAGCSLPPKVSGRRCGSVVLCVAHILESAVSSHPLPRVSLVRVRWWGEEAPGSLFRPTLLSADGVGVAEEAQDAPRRAIAMKYPVSVLPEQLVEYFQDMRHLTLEVIDRNSRKKVGECILELNLQAHNAVMTPQEKLVALRRQDELCEIRPTAEDAQDGEVLGYLAVTFDVQWMSSEVEAEEESVVVRDAVWSGEVGVYDGAATVIDVEEEDAALSTASSDSLPSKRVLITADKGGDKEVASLDSISVDVNSEQALKDSSRRETVVESPESNGDFQRIQRLLEKGRALKQSMERAVTDEESGHGEELNVIDKAPALTKVIPHFAIEQLSFVPGADLARPGAKLYEAPIGGGYQPNPLVSQPLVSLPSGFEEQHVLRERLNRGISPCFLKEINALTLTFKSLELESDFVDCQLRQLRDSSSVSSRFSPIQISVSHGDIVSLLYNDADGVDLPARADFSVTTSLRKRQWNLECNSTVQLTPPPNRTRNAKSSTSKRNAKLRFVVRCENQNDARRSKKRYEQDRLSRPSKFILLEGTVDSATLFSVAERADKTWSTTVELLPANELIYNAKVVRGVRQHQEPTQEKLQRNKTATPVGYLKVSFAFFVASPSDDDSARDGGTLGNESGSEFLLSSISSIPSEEDPRQRCEIGAESGAPVSEQALFQKLHREVYTRMQHEPVLKSPIRDKHNCEFLQFAVMLEEVSHVKSSVTKKGRMRSLLKGTSSNVVVSDERRRDSDLKMDVGSMSLRYAVPSRFSRIPPASKKTFDRTVTRKLRTSRWLGAGALLRADFSGNMHVFQPSFAEDASEYFFTAFLIVEVWVHSCNDADRTLIGLAKVPLRNLAELFRGDTDLLSLMERPLPFVGVDGRLMIENPFTGKPAGHLKARVSVGTAEQLLAWASTARVIVKLQGIIRGHLLRKRLRGSGAILRPAELELRDTAFPSCAIALSSDISQSDSQSTSPTLSTTLQRLQVLSLDDSCTKTDGSEKRSECLSTDLDTFGVSSQSWLALRKIRFDVRECWRTAMQCKDQPGGKQQQRDWSTAPILGCELQGQLVISGGTASKGMSFALWWDAANRRLNSSFAHTFRATGVGADLPLVGSQSQVLFALHVENGFLGTQSRETIMGEARLNLFEAFCKRGGKQNSMDSPAQRIGAEESWVDVNIPIEWDSGSREYQRLPSVIPLKIFYHIVPLMIRSEEAVDSGSDISSYDDSGHAAEECFGSITTIPAIHRLHPPIITVDEIDELLVLGSSAGQDHGIGVMSASPSQSSCPDFDAEGQHDNTGSWDTVGDRPEQQKSAPSCGRDTAASGNFEVSTGLKEVYSVSDEKDFIDFGDSAENVANASNGHEVAPGSDADSALHDGLNFSTISGSLKESENGATGDDNGVNESGHEDLCAATADNAAVEDQSEYNASSGKATSTDEATSDNEGVNESEHAERSIVATAGKTAGDGVDQSGLDASALTAVNDTGDAESADQINYDTTIGMAVSSDVASDVDGADQSQHMSSGVPKSDTAEYGSDGADQSEQDVISGLVPLDKAAADDYAVSESDVDLSSGVSTADNERDDDDDDAEAFHTEIDLVEIPAPSTETTTAVSACVEIPQALDNVMPASLADNSLCIDAYNPIDSESSSCSSTSSEGTTPGFAAETNDEQVQRDSRPPAARVVQYADKATQVNPCELEVEVEPSCSIQITHPVNSDDACDSGIELSPDSHDIHYDTLTVDVGCDAITIASLSSSGGNILFEDKSVQASPTIHQDSQTKSEDTEDGVGKSITEDDAAGPLNTRGDEERSTAQLNPSDQDSTPGLTQNQPHIESAHSSLQSEKLELVYEMLREMRDSYHFARPLLTTTGRESRGFSDQEEKKEVTAEQANPMPYDDKRIREKRCSCPSSPLSRDTSSRLGQINYLEVDSLGEKLAKSLQTSMSAKHPDAIDYNPPKASSQLQLRVETANLDLDGSRSVGVLRASLHDDDEEYKYRGSRYNDRLSSSVTKLHYDLPGSNRVEKKDEHSSVHSLFAHDSETERIARIMQGSMNYWMKDDSSSSSISSLEEETDDGCYF